MENTQKCLSRNACRHSVSTFMLQVSNPIQTLIENGTETISYLAMTIKTCGMMILMNIFVQNSTFSKILFRQIQVLLEILIIRLHPYI